MRKVVIMSLVLCTMLSFGFVASESSSNDIVVNILGCSDGVNFASPGQCLGSTGYCADHDTILDVFEEPNACSAGVTPFGSPETGLFESQVCCPSGSHRCISNGTTEGRGYGPGPGGAIESDAYFCVPALSDCSDFTDELSCDGSTNGNFGQCFWNGQAGECQPRSNTCYEYQDQATCEDDPLNVSQLDPNCRYGSSLSGGIEYVISQESCECVWNDDDPSNEFCTLNTTTVPGIGNNPDAFSTCQFSLVQAACVDGFQDYLYEANFNANTLDELLPGDARCVNRSGRRRCGEPIVKVPFFDSHNIVILILLIALFYLLRSGKQHTTNKKLKKGVKSSNASKRGSKK